MKFSLIILQLIGFSFLTRGQDSTTEKFSETPLDSTESSSFASTNPSHDDSTPPSSFTSTSKQVFLGKISSALPTTPTAPVTTTQKPTPAPLHPMFKKLDWLVGKWRGEFSGKVFWPTIPTMNYGEELIIEEAPVAKSSGVRFLNFSARAWSHTTKDQLHDEWGFMTITEQGNVTLMTAGNNGFTTYEEGWVDGQQLILRLKKIGRISFSRDLPVEDLERRFKRLDKTYLEQALRMRTATHPRVGLLDHTIIIYEKKS
uniref:THAP4-like heme-binding beta-barrel domain-containing protein n=1 Tax=Romanomermis culicivorax TaxID=13658 RepID=A0A915JYM8_ROMCU